MGLKPRPSLEHFIQLPKDQKVITVQSYRKEHIRYPKWKFWRNEKVKYHLALVTSSGKLYIIDPDTPSVEQVENKEEK